MLISSSSASTISKKQSESATGEPWAMLPTSVATLRICGEPNRWVSAVDLGQCALRERFELSPGHVGADRENVVIARDTSPAR